MKMFQTDPTVLARLQAAAARGPSAEDLHQQKVSFIASSLSDGKTVVTTAQVERELRKLAGQAA